MITPLDPRTVAPHLRESVFRDYEPLIARAVTSWPVESAFTVPTGIAPTTFIANFRNAILSVKAYKWPTSIVDMTKLWRMADEKEYVINQDATGTIWFRKRQPRGRPNMMTDEAKSTIGSAPPLSLVPWRDCTQDEVHALCLLLSNKRIEGPVVVSGAVPEGLDTLFDVGVAYDDVTKTTIIT